MRFVLILLGNELANLLYSNVIPLHQWDPVYRKFLEQNPKFDPSATYVLPGFPKNYDFRTHKKTSPTLLQPRHDRYLFVKTVDTIRFRSGNEYHPHLVWMATDPARDWSRCACQYCRAKASEVTMSFLDRRLTEYRAGDLVWIPLKMDEGGHGLVVVTSSQLEFDHDRSQGTIEAMNVLLWFVISVVFEKDIVWWPAMVRQCFVHWEFGTTTVVDAYSETRFKYLVTLLSEPRGLKGKEWLGNFIVHEHIIAPYLVKHLTDAEAQENAAFPMIESLKQAQHKAEISATSYDLSPAPLEPYLMLLEPQNNIGKNGAAKQPEIIPDPILRWGTELIANSDTLRLRVGQSIRQKITHPWALEAQQVLKNELPVFGQVHKSVIDKQGETRLRVALYTIGVEASSGRWSLVPIDKHSKTTMNVVLNKIFGKYHQDWPYMMQAMPVLVSGKDEAMADDVTEETKNEPASIENSNEAVNQFDGDSSLETAEFVPDEAVHSASLASNTESLVTVAETVLESSEEPTVIGPNGQSATVNSTTPLDKEPEGETLVFEQDSPFVNEVSADDDAESSAGSIREIEAEDSSDDETMIVENEVIMTYGESHKRSVEQVDDAGVLAPVVKKVAT